MEEEISVDNGKDEALVQNGLKYLKPWYICWLLDLVLLNGTVTNGD